jgi:5-methylthioribose kinase
MLTAPRRFGVFPVRVLDADNAADYLRETGWLGPGPFRITELAGGVSNVVLRVETPAGWFVLKQSRPQLRTASPWFSDVSRVFREIEVMRLLAPLLPEGAVPRVLHADADAFAFLMTHAPADARDWRSVLLAGEVHPTLGTVAGQLLGRIHERTAGLPEALAAFADGTVFRQLRTEPFYDRVRERHPDLSGPVGRLVGRLENVTDALCHGDYSPKNLLLAAGAFTLVDHETAYRGDPAMDLGFFQSHILLKAIHLPERAGDLHELARRFRDGYASQVRFRPAEELEAAGVAHCGLCLVARVDGTSPAPYLREGQEREAARRLGRRVLLEGVTTWEGVLERAGA